MRDYIVENVSLPTAGFVINHRHEIPNYSDKIWLNDGRVWDSYISTEFTPKTALDCCIVPVMRIKPLDSTKDFREFKQGERIEEAGHMWTLITPETAICDEPLNIGEYAELFHTNSDTLCRFADAQEIMRLWKEEHEAIFDLNPVEEVLLSEDFDKLASFGFNSLQIKQLELGIKNGLSVAEVLSYADLGLDADAMGEKRKDHMRYAETVRENREGVERSHIFDTIGNYILGKQEVISYYKGKLDKITHPQYTQEDVIDFYSNKIYQWRDEEYEYPSLNDALKDGYAESEYRSYLVQQNYEDIERYKEEIRLSDVKIHFLEKLRNYIEEGIEYPLPLSQLEKLGEVGLKGTYSISRPNAVTRDGKECIFEISNPDEHDIEQLYQIFVMASEHGYSEKEVDNIFKVAARYEGWFDILNSAQNCVKDSALSELNYRTSGKLGLELSMLAILTQEPPMIVIGDSIDSLLVDALKETLDNNNRELPAEYCELLPYLQSCYVEDDAEIKTLMKNLRTAVGEPDKAYLEKAGVEALILMDNRLSIAQIAKRIETGRVNEEEIFKTAKEKLSGFDYLGFRMKVAKERKVFRKNEINGIALDITNSVAEKRLENTKAGLPEQDAAKIDEIKEKILTAQKEAESPSSGVYDTLYTIDQTLVSIKKLPEGAPLRKIIDKLENIEKLYDDCREVMNYINTAEAERLQSAIEKIFPAISNIVANIDEYKHIVKLNEFVPSAESPDKLLNKIEADLQDCVISMHNEMAFSIDMEKMQRQAKIMSVQQGVTRGDDMYGSREDKYKSISEDIGKNELTDIDDAREM